MLPIDEKTLEIPHGKELMGRSNIWYADKPKGHDIQRKVISFIDNKPVHCENRRSQTTDPEHNAKVEKVAIYETQKYFEKLGYHVESVEKDNVGWDLEATFGRINLLDSLHN